jgi:RNA polymerase sigma factor (sigma-70 family)
VGKNGPVGGLRRIEYEEEEGDEEENESWPLKVASDHIAKSWRQRRPEEEVREALQELRERHRNLLIAIYYEGRTTKELAKKRGVVQSRIRVLKMKALRALREAMEG